MTTAPLLAPTTTWSLNSGPVQTGLPAGLQLERAAIDGRRRPEGQRLRRHPAYVKKHLRRITVDTTVQPKAVTHPTDGKLLHRVGDAADGVALDLNAIEL